MRVTPEYFDSAGAGLELFPMSQRSHFWIRVVGLALILAAEFGPKLWTSAQSATAAPLETAAETR